MQEQRGSTSFYWWKGWKKRHIWNYKNRYSCYRNLTKKSGSNLISRRWKKSLQIFKFENKVLWRQWSQWSILETYQRQEAELRTPNSRSEGHARGNFTLLQTTSLQSWPKDLLSYDHPLVSQTPSPWSWLECWTGWWWLWWPMWWCW